MQCVKISAEESLQVIDKQDVFMIGIGDSNAGFQTYISNKDTLLSITHDLPKIKKFDYFYTIKEND